MRRAVAVLLISLGCSSSSGSRDAKSFDVGPVLAIPGTSFTLSIQGPFGAGKGDAATVVLTRNRALDGTIDGALFTTATTKLQAPVGKPEIDLPLTLPADLQPGVYGAHVTTSGGDDFTVPDALLVTPPVSALPLASSAVCSPRTGTAQLRIPVANYYDFTPVSAVFQGAASVHDVLADGCAVFPYVTRGIIHSCNTLVVELDAFGGPPVKATLTVKSNYPGAAPSFDVPLLLDQAQTLAVAIPQAYSTADAPAPVHFHGQFAGALHVDAAAPPTASLDGVALTPAFSSCTETGLPGHSLCTAATVTLPQGTPAGVHQLTLTTMPGCTSDGLQLPVLDPPQVASVRGSIASADANVACVSDARALLTFSGTNLYAPQVAIDGVGVSIFSDPACSGFNPSACSFVQAADVLPGQASVMLPGAHTVTIRSGTSPSVSRTFQFNLVRAGTASVVSPQLLNPAQDRQVFVPLQGVHGSLVSAVLVAGAAAVPAKAIAAVDGGALVTVPAGIASNDWQVVVRDESSCPIARQDGQADFSERDFFDLTDDNFPSKTITINFTGSLDSATADRQPHGDTQAAHFAAGAGAPWSFFIGHLSADIGAFSFDLRRSGTGSPVAGPDLTLSGSGFSLEYTLSPAPQDAWTRYTVSLDDAAGWTRRDSNGNARPATRLEVQLAFHQSFGLLVRGSGFDGNTDGSYDNPDWMLVH